MVKRVPYSCDIKYPKEFAVSYQEPQLREKKTTAKAISDSTHLDLQSLKSSTMSTVNQLLNKMDLLLL